MNKAPHVEALRVSKSYILGGNEVCAVRDVSLRLDRGEFVALCGSSGSGKTTLLNLIGCIAAPSSGRIFITGREVSLLNDLELADFRASHLGFIFQTFNLLPVLTALENVEYALLRRRTNAGERREIARAALAQVGLSKYEHHRPSQLSGGQRQRVAIARAFVRRPELIIADEPTANLDKTTAGEILDLMAQLNQSTGSTVIMATHDAMAMARAKRRIDISDGLVKSAA